MDTVPPVGALRDAVGAPAIVRVTLRHDPATGRLIALSGQNAAVYDSRANAVADRHTIREFENVATVGGEFKDGPGSLRQSLLRTRGFDALAAVLIAD